MTEQALPKKSLTNFSNKDLLKVPSYLLAPVKTYLKAVEIKKIQKAYTFAFIAHDGQKRKDGSAYISHPVAVAKIIAELKMDHDSICAALMHDVLEDCDVQKTVLEKIEELNNDESVSGILVQLPLPKHIDKQKVIETIIPSKDVDGFHPMNVGNLSSGYESSVPCTPLGCYLMIKKIEPNLSGKKAVVVGRSNLNGKPMTQLLLKENCTVTITHSRTKDLKAECLEADIIVAAVGIPELVKGDWVKKDAIVIDVGINKTENGLVGDVAFDEVSKVAKALTPVPGGVGPMTIACLLKNTVECFKRSQK